MGVQDVVARLNNSKDKSSNNTIKANSSPLDIMSAIKKLEQKKEKKPMPPTPVHAAVLTPVPIQHRQQQKQEQQPQQLVQLRQAKPPPPPPQLQSQTEEEEEDQQDKQDKQELKQSQQKMTNVTITTGNTTNNSTNTTTTTATNMKKKMTAAPSLNSDLVRFDRIAAEIMEIHSSLLEENQTHVEKMNKLQTEVDKYSSDATKVRDYEIRVEYLAQKLEQISDERDILEKELRQLRNKSGVSSPLSPAFTQVFPTNPVLTEQDEDKNDEFMTDILNVYEEIEDDDDLDDDSEERKQEFMANKEEMDSQQQTDLYSQHLIEYDKGVQMTISTYISQSETQRLEIKRLKDIMQKQDTLIKRLEVKLSVEPDELLKEQVKVQSIELENKRKLLSQLLNEREELKRKLADNNRPYIPINQERASIDVLLDITNSIDFKRPNSYMSIDSSSTCSTTGRGTPPLTNPPKHPLPPLPPKQKTLN